MCWSRFAAVRKKENQASERATNRIGRISRETAALANDRHKLVGGITGRITGRIAGAAIGSAVGGSVGGTDVGRTLPQRASERARAMARTG